MNNDIDYLKNLVEEYQLLVAPLNDELTLYKKDNEALKMELLKLEHGNKVLSLKLEETLRTLASSMVAINRFNDDDILENLRNQLAMAIKEKESITKMWKNGIKRVDELEHELKQYSVGSQRFSKSQINMVKRGYDKKMKSLQSELKDIQIKLDESTKNSQEGLRRKSQEYEELLQKYNETNETIKQLQEENSFLQEKQSIIQDSIEKLKETIEAKNKTIEKFKEDLYYAKLKVAEACHVAEAAMIEKDSALGREREAQEQIYKLMATLHDIVNETEEMVLSEVKAVKDKYDGHIKTINVELKTSRNELQTKNEDLEIKERLCKELEVDMDRMKHNKIECDKIAMSEKQLLNTKIDDLYQTLIATEKKAQELAADNIELKNLMNKILKNNEDHILKKEANKNALEYKVQCQESELLLNNSKLVEAVSRIDDLNYKMHLMGLQLHKDDQLKTAKSDQHLKDTIRDIRGTTDKANLEGIKQLEAQIALNNKWKTEMKSVTNILEIRLQELRRELFLSEDTKKKLKNKLIESQKKCSLYQEHLLNICTEFNNMANSFVT